MTNKNFDMMSIIGDMIESCTRVVEKAVAIKALRAVCRYFGGQLIYIPVNKTTGETTEELRGVISDAVGDAAASKILEKLMSLMGGYQIYIPMEKNAFREIIASEIYERYDNDKEKVRDLCREYGMSFTQVYRLWAEGRDNKRQMHFDFGNAKQ